jgi:hypothetical protein
LRSSDLREHHIRIAINTFEGLIRQFEGNVFRMSTDDLVLVCRGATPTELDQVMGQLRYLFADDPVAQDTNETATDGLCTWFDLERQYDFFLSFVRKIHSDEIRRQKRLAEIGGQGPAQKRPPINAGVLHELIRIIASADLTNVMRRQAVFALMPNQEPQALFRELYVSIAALQAQIVPKYDILADKWLFQHLTETLDRRMISLLKHYDDSTIAKAFSINLNVSTVVSAEFLTFDSTLRASSRGTVVIELQAIDVLSDLVQFCFARDFLRNRKYRICLDGVTEAMLPFIDREALGVDFVKLVWSPGLAGHSPTTRGAPPSELIARIGKARIILSRCGDQDAVRFGQFHGLAMFQGRYLDGLAAARKPINVSRP